MCELLLTMLLLLLLLWWWLVVEDVAHGASHHRWWRRARLGDDRIAPIVVGSDQHMKDALWWTIPATEIVLETLPGVQFVFLPVDLQLFRTKTKTTKSSQWLCAGHPHYHLLSEDDKRTKALYPTKENELDTG